MLAIVLAALTASASPSPSPTPLLKTIVTVKTSPLCGEFAAHTNAAITSAVQNDQTLGSTILMLRSHDLAESSLSRNAEIHHLDSLASSIYKQYRAGEQEVDQLRALAAKDTDPTEKAALKASADALGGALYRQHLMQRDLDGFVAFLYASDMTTGDDAGSRHPLSQDVPWAQTNEIGPNEYGYATGLMRGAPFLAGSESVEDDVRMAKAASEDFQSRMPAVMQDELNAGAHIEQAADHC
ncbi:MAG TPA: hypothetical protein VMA98_09950 [Candidatus Acidoferrales bacterium]|nr:hypothetical protein [Candidatus Acidoferrales bacterium]